MPLKPIVLHSCYFVVCWLVGFLFVDGSCSFKGLQVAAENVRTDRKSVV